MWTETMNQAKTISPGDLIEGLPHQINWAAYPVIETSFSSSNFKGPDTERDSQTKADDHGRAKLPLKR